MSQVIVAVPAPEHPAVTDVHTSPEGACTDPTNSADQCPPDTLLTELALCADAAVTENAGACATGVRATPCSSAVWPLIAIAVEQVHPPVYWICHAFVRFLVRVPVKSASALQLMLSFAWAPAEPIGAATARATVRR
jgi:hypothetical protein